MTGEQSDKFAAAVTDTVSAIPRGETCTYGEVAAEAGFPGAARAVGNLLRVTPGLPWWRVIAADGRLVPGIEADHAQRLRAEGVAISRGAVVMRGRQ